MIRWRCPSPSMRLTRPGTPTIRPPKALATCVLPPTRAAGSSRSSRAASLSLPGLAPAFPSTAGTAAPTRTITAKAPNSARVPLGKESNREHASLLGRTATARGPRQAQTSRPAKPQPTAPALPEARAPAKRRPLTHRWNWSTNAPPHLAGVERRACGAQEGGATRTGMFARAPGGRTPNVHRSVGGERSR